MRFIPLLAFVLILPVSQFALTQEIPSDFL